MLYEDKPLTEDFLREHLWYLQDSMLNMLCDTLKLGSIWVWYRNYVCVLYKVVIRDDRSIILYFFGTNNLLGSSLVFPSKVLNSSTVEARLVGKQLYAFEDSSSSEGLALGRIFTSYTEFPTKGNIKNAYGFSLPVFGRREGGICISENQLVAFMSAQGMDRQRAILIKKQVLIIKEKLNVSTEY